MKNNISLFRPFTLNLNGKIWQVDKPLVMGILNCTQDSFYDGGKYLSEEALASQAKALWDGGADILDIGAYSTRPGAQELSEKEELERCINGINIVKKYIPEAIISVDTFRSNVAHEAVKAGSHMVNDVSGGSLDPRMWETLGDLQVPYIFMHMRGTPATMQKQSNYDDLILDLLGYFSSGLKELRALGVKDVMIDPGFGFAKNLDQNYYLLKHLDVFHQLEAPILVGLSRKSMIYKLLGKGPESALNGTSVVHALALLKGATILRVHDAIEAKECISIIDKYQSIDTAI